MSVAEAKLGMNTADRQGSPLGSVQRDGGGGLVQDDTRQKEPLYGPLLQRPVVPAHRIATTTNKRAQKSFTRSPLFPFASACLVCLPDPNSPIHAQQNERAWAHLRFFNGVPLGFALTTKMREK